MRAKPRWVGGKMSVEDHPRPTACPRSDGECAELARRVGADVPFGKPNAAIPVVVNGVRYETITEAASHVDVSASSISYALRTGRRYVRDVRVERG